MIPQFHTGSRFHYPIQLASISFHFMLSVHINSFIFVLLEHKLTAVIKQIVIPNLLEVAQCNISLVASVYCATDRNRINANC